jgi:hypothetical protein
MFSLSSCSSHSGASGGQHSGRGEFGRPGNVLEALAAPPWTVEGRSSTLAGTRGRAAGEALRVRAGLLQRRLRRRRNETKAGPVTGATGAHHPPLTAPSRFGEARTTAMRGGVCGVESRAGAKGCVGGTAVPSGRGRAAAGGRGDEEASARAATRHGAREELRDAAALGGHRGGSRGTWHEPARLAVLALRVGRAPLRSRGSR